MRGRKIIPKRDMATRRGPTVRGHDRSDHALELIDLVVEAAKSRELPAFLAAFAGRAAEMLEADWGVLGEIRGNKVELHGPEQTSPHLPQSPACLLENVFARRAGLRARAGRGR